MESDKSDKIRGYNLKAKVVGFYPTYQSSILCAPTI